MKKNRGSVLQIVLVIFLVLFTSLLSYCTLMTQQYQLSRYSDLMNQQRRIEIILRRYWRQTLDQDILLSDTISVGENIVDYTVDDNGKDYIIDCEIRTQQYSYTMKVKIDMDTYDLHECQYGKL